MRAALFDPWGYATSWAARLQDEGTDVLVYLGTEDPVKRVGEGIVPRETSYERWVDWAKESPEDTVVLFCASHYGTKADDLRRQGLKVVGAGEFPDKLEKDRMFGQQVAEHAGIAIPEFASFTSVSHGIDALRARSEGGVFKTDTYLEADATQVCGTGEKLVNYLKQVRDRYRDRVSFIVQDLIGGDGAADFDVNRWWDGNEWVGPYGLTIEHKRFLNGDLGQSTGCALNAIWFEEENDFADELGFDRLTDLFRSVQAPPCIYAINTRVDDADGKVYFLEWTPRLGFDSEMTAALLIDNLSDFLWRVATGEGGTEISSDLSYGVRLTVPPYPFERVETDRYSANGLAVPWEGDVYSAPFIGYQIARVDDGYEIASAKALLGLAAATGDDLGSMHEGVIDFAKELHKGLSKLQLRTDGMDVIRADAKKLEALGIDVHAAILKGA